jgi:hypothetical protein
VPLGRATSWFSAIQGQSMTIQILVQFRAGQIALETYTYTRRRRPFHISQLLDPLHDDFEEQERVQFTLSPKDRTQVYKEVRSATAPCQTRLAQQAKANRASDSFNS